MLKQRKHLIALLFIAGLFSPIFGGLMHAFQNHEHTSCFAKNELHLHKTQKDCSSFHQIQNITQDFESYQEVVSLNFYFKSTHFITSQQLELQNSKINTLRGPPVNIF